MVPLQTRQIESSLAKLQACLIVAYAVSLPISITGTGILLVAGIFVWLISAIIGWQQAKKEGERGDQTRGFAKTESGFPLAKPFLAFALAVALSGFANGGLNEALSSLWSFRLLIVPFWTYHAFASNRKLSGVCVQFLLATTSLAAVWGTIQQVFNFHPFSYKYLQGTGFLGGPMAFAGQMQVFSLLALAFLLTKGYSALRRPFNSGIVFGAITLANLAGVVFAAERSAWLGEVFGVLALTLALSRKLFAKTVLALVAFVIAAWICLPVVHQRLEPLLNWKQDVSARVRVYLWQESINLWSKSPVFGVGIRHFPRFDIPEAIVPGRSKDIGHAHSNYLHILSTTGLIGLAAFLWLQFATLSLAWRILFAKDDWENGDQECHDELRLPSDRDMQRSLALAVFAYTIALMISGIFEYNFGTSQVLQASWLVLGMLRNPTRQAKQTLAETKGK